MGLSRVKKKFFFSKKFSKKNRKKHVETMFITPKAKKYPYYYKSLLTTLEHNKTNFFQKNKLWYLRTKNNGLLNINIFKAFMRIFKWFTKTYKIEDFVTLNILLFPDFVFTSKAKDVRMGKGKGLPSKSLAFYKKGQNFAVISLKLKKNSPLFKKYAFLIEELLKKLIKKLPSGFFFSKKSW